MEYGVYGKTLLLTLIHNYFDYKGADEERGINRVLLLHKVSELDEFGACQIIASIIVTRVKNKGKYLLINGDKKN